jgi:hypothetical protein
VCSWFNMDDGNWEESNVRTNCLKIHIQITIVPFSSRKCKFQILYLWCLVIVTVCIAFVVAGYSSLIMIT